MDCRVTRSLAALPALATGAVFESYPFESYPNSQIGGHVAEEGGHFVVTINQRHLRYVTPSWEVYGRHRR